MNGEAHTSCSVHAHADTEIVTEWLETGTLSVRVGTIANNGRLFLHRDAAERLLAALSAALEAETTIQQREAA